MSKKSMINFVRFTDPSKKFSLTVPANWKLVRLKGNQNPTSFQLRGNHAFQISCMPIKDHHKELITANQLEPQNSKGQLFFVERYHEDKQMIAYTWLCIVDEYLILATYILPNKLNLKRPPETPSIRMSLSSLRFHGENQPHLKPGTGSERTNVDLEDIAYWNLVPEKYFNSLSDKKTGQRGLKRAELTDINVLSLYSLLKSVVSPEPNGFYSVLREGFPMDNMVWWDFVFESEKGFVHIWRTANLIEAHYKVNEPDFDLIKFLNANIKRHINKVQEIKKSFTKYNTYINQYRSYKDCVDHLWKEVSKIDISIPENSLSHIKTPGESKKYPDRLKKFVDTSIRFHTLGKSLVLNAAFQIESFLNLVIRVGATQQLRDYSDVLNKHLKSQFPDRLKNMKFYSQIISKDVDMQNKAIKDSLELMNLRNKYVHFDESSSHNRLEDVYFDHDFPLHEISKHQPGIEAFRQMFHTPNIAAIKKAYETANNFVDYIHSLFLAEIQTYMLQLLNQNPIGYNTVRNTYSVIYKDLIVEFFVTPKVISKRKKGVKRKVSKKEKGTEH